MKRETETIIAATFLIIIFGMVSNLLVSRRSATLAEEYYGTWACTADTYVCPDGTSVGRVPPYCHFASCPLADTLSVR